MFMYMTHITLGIGIQSQPIVVINFFLYFHITTKNNGKMHVLVKTLQKELVQDKSTFGIAIKT